MVPTCQIRYQGLEADLGLGLPGLAGLGSLDPWDYFYSGDILLYRASVNVSVTDRFLPGCDKIGNVNCI